MSPEQCRGSKEIDARTDVYALGVIAYQMLTGCLPFGAVALGELLYKHLTERPPSLETLEPSVPAALCSLIAQTLEKEPEDRPTLAQIDVALGAASAKDSSPDTGRFASRGGTRALEAGPPTTLGGAASQVGPVGSGESERRGRSWIPRIVAATLVVGGAAAAAIVSLNHKSPPAKIEIPPQTGPKETVLSGPPEPPPPTPPAPVPAPPSPDPSPDPIAAVESPAVAAIAQGKAKNKIKNKPKGKTNEAVEGAGAPVPGMAGPAGEIYRGSKLKIETEYPGP
jgi:serine/threonine-protein kinase